MLPVLMTLKKVDLLAFWAKERLLRVFREQIIEALCTICVSTLRQ